MQVLRPVTHELRTPLHTITLSAERLLKGPGASHAQAILAAAEHARRLTQDLQGTARLMSGTVTLHRRALRVGDLVDRVLQSHQPLAEERGVLLEPRVSAKDTQVSADPDRALQVFANLVENAIRYSEAGGAVTIRAEDGNEGLGKVRFAVEDQGPGIPPDRRARLLDETEGFSELDGEGIGLVIAKAVVVAHGGSIWAEERQSGGCRVAFTLPLESLGPQGSDAPSSDAPSSNEP